MGHGVLVLIGDEALLHNLVAGFPTYVLFIIIAVCLLLLVRGADWMIDGAVALALRTGLPRIVIGATIISLGTTTPEAVVSVMAAWMGNPGLALGNGVGSIIADTGLIFGLTCLLTAVPANRFILNRTGWVQVGAATLLVVISVITLITTTGEATLGRWVGFSFLALLVCYMYITYVWAKKGEGLATEGEDSDDSELISFGKMFSAGLWGPVSGCSRCKNPGAERLGDRGQIWWCPKTLLPAPWWHLAHPSPN